MITREKSNLFTLHIQIKIKKTSNVSMQMHIFISNLPLTLFIGFIKVFTQEMENN